MAWEQFSSFCFDDLVSKAHEVTLVKILEAIVNYEQYWSESAILCFVLHDYPSFLLYSHELSDAFNYSLFYGNFFFVIVDNYRESTRKTDTKMYDK